MFLGPVEASKPWDTNGIDGVNRFLKRLWGLFFKGDEMQLVDEKPSPEALKSIHKLIKKVSQDIEQFSYNTSVAAFMICVNELSSMKCKNKSVYRDLVVLLAPFAPHIAEELWHALGEQGTVCDAQWPEFDEKYLVESTVKMPVQFNGKVRFTLDLPVDMSKEDIEKTALSAPEAAKYLEGMQVVKTVVVPGRIINIVIKPA